MISRNWRRVGLHVCPIFINFFLLSFYSLVFLKEIFSQHFKSVSFLQCLYLDHDKRIPVYNSLMVSANNLESFSSALAATAIISAKLTGFKLSGSHSSVTTETATQGSCR